MILAIWKKYSKLPFGRFWFGIFIRRFVPYSGTIRPRVQELSLGHVVIQMHDRRGVRNHLRSVHAVALMNLAELASGIAVVTGLPPTVRGIVRGFSIEFFKKARGTLTATCNYPPSPSLEKREENVEVEVKNESGEVVCRATAKWWIGPT